MKVNDIIIQKQTSMFRFTRTENSSDEYYTWIILNRKIRQYRIEYNIQALTHIVRF